MDPGLEGYAYTCRQTKENSNKTSISKYGSCMNNTRPKQQLSLYFVVFMHLFLCIFDGLFYVLELLLFNVSITCYSHSFDFNHFGLK